MNTTRPQPRLTMIERVVTRKADAGEHIGLEEAQPVLVRDVEERLRLEDASVVDQDVGVRRRANDVDGALRGTEIARRRDEGARRPLRP